jgi:hypothetical protein
VSKPLHQSLAEYIEGCGHAVTVVPFPESGIHAINFRSRGERFQVNVSGDDPEFLHIIYRWRLPERRPSEDELRRIALEVQGVVKSAKVAVQGGVVTSQVEQIVNGESFQPIFWRCADLAQQGARKFYECLGCTPVDQQDEAHAAAQRFLSTLDLGASGKDAGDGKKRPRPRKNKGVKRTPQTEPSDPSPTT